MKKRKRCRKKKPQTATAPDDDPGAGDAATPAAASSSSAPGGTAAKAAKRKKGALEAEPQQSSEEETDEDEDEEADDDEDDAEKGESEDDDMDVEFEFLSPDEDVDFQNVKDFLQSGTFGFVDLNFSELADTIAGQGNIGTIIKSGSDDDATSCALLTILNLQQFPSLSWPRTLQKALIAKAGKSADPTVKAKLEGVLAGKAPGAQVGLILSERMVNLPPKLIPPLHKVVLEDIEWSCSTPEMPEDERPFYRFTHFVGIARTEDVAGSASSRASVSAPRKRRREAAAAAAPGGGNACQRTEDEFYVKRADFSFSFPAGGRSDDGGAGGKTRETRTVFCLTRKAFEAAIAEMQTSMVVE